MVDLKKMKQKKHMPDDTHPEIESIIIEGYRRMTPARKIDLVRAMTQALQELALADIRQRRPSADAAETALRLASRRLDPGIMRRVFGWDPDVEGY